MVDRRLKAAAVLEFGSQVGAAKALGWHQSKFSRLVNGRIKPRPEEAKLIHEKLGVDLVEKYLRSEVGNVLANAGTAGTVKKPKE